MKDDYDLFCEPYPEYKESGCDVFDFIKQHQTEFAEFKAELERQRLLKIKECHKKMDEIVVKYTENYEKLDDSTKKYFPEPKFVDEMPWFLNYGLSGSISTLLTDCGITPITFEEANDLPVLGYLENRALNPYLDAVHITKLIKQVKTNREAFKKWALVFGLTTFKIIAFDNLPKVSLDASTCFVFYEFYRDAIAHACK